METKFITYEMAVLAMQAAQYVKAIEGCHVTTSICPNRKGLELSIYSHSPNVECLPDGYLFSERGFHKLEFNGPREVFVTDYYFNY